MNAGASIRSVRVIHFAVVGMGWDSLSKVAPEISAPLGQPEPRGLVMVDSDKEIHVFLLSDEDRAKLVQLLTGGIQIASGVQVPQ